jgi:hypothetical protein
LKIFLFYFKFLDFSQKYFYEIFHHYLTSTFAWALHAIQFIKHTKIKSSSFINSAKDLSSRIPPSGINASANLSSSLLMTVFVYIFSPPSHFLHAQLRCWCITNDYALTQIHLTLIVIFQIYWSCRDINTISWCYF